MLRKILIVDDIRTNVLILKAILVGDYDVLEAYGGAEALDILQREGGDVSAVLLDIGMPGIDGYEVLRRIRSDMLLSELPVIMITGSDDEQSRIDSLAEGANDYVTKPYNAEVIRHCLRNHIAFHEASATLYALQRDRLTGLLSRDTFFEKAAEELARESETDFVLGCLDIDNFKVINDQYGAEKGDEIIRAIADALRASCARNGGLCGRIAADNFISLYEAQLTEGDNIGPDYAENFVRERTGVSVTVSVGRYFVTDRGLPISAMYDRAKLAQRVVKGRYGQRVAVYDETMRSELIREQEIVAEMKSALEAGQFEPWFQPQYNHLTGAMIGAEALVRWRHPEKGLIPPFHFIPVFERNGFIYELDKYVWEQVCKRLRRWLDEGRNPLPVSVNISRHDILHSDMTDVISGLVAKYMLPVELLRLEVTESAFAQDSGTIISVVKQLIDMGFTLEIDDFGSGYSSLNTLKDVPAQILKLDMKFMESGSGTQRGGNIVESVVRMAKWLGMSVIAEGVETLAQADYLASIGCGYIQGYLYARPMSTGDYETHCRGLDKEEHLLTLETVENLDNNSLWDPESMDSFIFNGYVGAACIFEYRNGVAELIRATRLFAGLFSETTTVDAVLNTNWVDYLAPESLRTVTAVMAESDKEKKPVVGELVFLDLPKCPHKTFLRCTLRVIAKTGDRQLIFCTAENVTAQREAEHREREATEQLATIMQNVRSGITAVTIENGQVNIIFSNQRFYELIGYTREQYDAEIHNAFSLVHPDDLEYASGEITRIMATRRPGRYEYRCFRRDGSIFYCRCYATCISLSGTHKQVLLSVMLDVSEIVLAQQEAKASAERLRLLTNSVPGGIAAYAIKPDGIEITYYNDGFCRMLGYTRDEYDALSKVSVVSRVFPQDQPALMEQVRAMYEHGTPINCTYRTRGADAEGCIWVSLRGELLERRGDVCHVNALLLDVTKQQMMLEQLRMSEEENILAVEHGGNIVCRFNIADRTLTLAAEKAAAYSLPEVISNVPDEPIRLGLISPETAEAYRGFFAGIQRGDRAGAVLYQQRYFDGWQWTEAKSSTIFSDDGKPVRAVISMFNVTDRVEKEAIYKKWQQSLMDREPDSFSLFHCNLNSGEAYTSREGRLLTFGINEPVCGFDERARDYVEHMVFADDREAVAAFINADTMLAYYYRGKRSRVLEYRELTPDSSYRWLKLTVELVESASSTDVEAYMMFENVDEDKRAELENIRLAETDPLTGVLNRAVFIKKVGQLLKNAPPEKRSALLMLDIDGFKRVNDVFGHSAGDQALMEIAHGLQSIVRSEDLVARFGGDEFMVFLNGIRDEQAVRAKAAQICALSRKALSLEVQISGSVGAAFAPYDGTDFDTLYKKVDSALYYVKGSGKDNIAVYSAEMSNEHLTPDTDPRHVLDGGAEKKRRILIVDDSIIQHELLHNIFAGEFIIEKAKDGSSALIRLRHYGSAISVVLLDLIMPGLDGFEVLRLMQESEELRSIPVIIVSGDDSRETCLRAIRAGAMDFVTKPVDADILRVRVRSAISKGENERLRAKNSLLELQSKEQDQSRLFLESPGVTFINYNWMTGAFDYCPTVSRYLLGRYDGRKLWRILLADMVADTDTVQSIQHLVHGIAGDRTRTEASIVVGLKTPKKETHSFRVGVRKVTNEFNLTNRLTITLVDMDYWERQDTAYL